jgi:D-alanine-D-alanine ligase
MRVLVLHSDVPPDAPADELDTLYTAQAVAEALGPRGYDVTQAAFTPDLEVTRALIAEHRPEVVFNLVEAIWRQGELACIAPIILEKLKVSYTGCPAAPMALAGDKPLAKRILRLGGLPTSDWDEPPFDNLEDGRKYIVKSATEDASLGLDEGCVVQGKAGVHARAKDSREKHGGRWFAEAYIHGREFNVSVLEENGNPRVLPIPEMEFRDWPAARPRVVGYDAKWDEESHECLNTVRQFGLDRTDPGLNAELIRLAEAAWRLFGLHGFARVDFRVDEAGRPFILELNPNSCLEPGAGFAAASAQAGMDYGDAVEKIIAAANGR